MSLQQKLLMVIIIALSDIEDDAYISTIYPSVSAEFSYKLADAGFFKRLEFAL